MRLGVAARIALSAAVFGAILWFLDVRSLAAIIAGASPKWLGVAALASLGGYYLSAHVLSALSGGSVGPAAIFRVNLISVYFGTFLPGDIAAGLVSRIRYLGMSSWQEVLNRTVAERLLGLAAYSVLAGTALAASRYWPVLGWLGFLAPVAVLLATAAGLAAMARPAAVLAAMPGLKRLLARVSSGGELPPLGLSCRAVAWVLATYLMMSLVPFALLRGLGVDIGYMDAIVIGYLLTIAQLVPFFFAGIGIRDLSALALMHAIGVASEVAIAFSALSLAMIIVLAVAGGVVQLGAEGKHTPGRGGDDS